MKKQGINKYQVLYNHKILDTNNYDEVKHITECYPQHVLFIDGKKEKDTRINPFRREV